jgi:formyl-CoA transferase
MSAINPRLVYARVKGYGLSGPYSRYPCYDPLAQAAAGTFSITGEADGPPLAPGPTIADTGTGIQTALAITAAYVQALNTGRGQQIEMSMQEATLSFMKTRPVPEWNTGRPIQRQGGRRNPPSGMYPCAPGGPNDYVYILVATLRMWDAFCLAIGKPEMITDPRFDTPQARGEHQEEIRQIVTDWTMTMDKHEAMRILGEAGIPASGIFDTVEVFTDTHLNARGFFETLQHPVVGEITLMRPPFRLSESPTEMKRAPLLGEHSEEVLRAELGLTDDDLTGLRSRGVLPVTTRPAGVGA